jgi:hypothetical protein
MTDPRGLLSWWLRVAALLVPSDERERWLEEWRSELASAGARGVSVVRRLRWAVGVAVAAAQFRGEEMSMDGWGREIRHAVRGLLRRPGFAAVTVLTLGLGIGANTAMFSVVNGVLLRPLPYAQPDRLVTVHSAFPTMNFEKFWISPPEYLELQERTTSFEVLGAYREGQTSIGGGDQPERVMSAIASATLFEALGVEPILGRTYTREEDLPGGGNVVVLSHEAWMRMFGGDPSIVGRAVDVNAVSRTVLGIMPPGFDVDERGIEAWLPLQLDPAFRDNRGSHYLYVVGRLADGEQS